MLGICQFCAVNQLYVISCYLTQVLWNHHNPFCAFTGNDAGLLACVDVRSPQPLWTHSAHTSALTSLVLSRSLTDCLVTASNDRLVKVWDISSADPKLVLERSCKIGAIHCASGCPDEQLVVCVGGEREMKVINIQNDERFREHFLHGSNSKTSPNEVRTEKAEMDDAEQAFSVEEASCSTKASKNKKDRKKRVKKSSLKHCD